MTKEIYLKGESSEAEGIVYPMSMLFGIGATMTGAVLLLVGVFTLPLVAIVGATTMIAGLLSLSFLSYDRSASPEIDDDATEDTSVLLPY